MNKIQSINLGIILSFGIFFITFFYHQVKERDITEAIVIQNSNPSFTKDTITRADFNDAGVTIFTASWCGYCKGAKMLLNQDNITFNEVDVDQYSISKLKLKKLGIEDFFVPQIFVDGIPIGGFSDLKKIFGSSMLVPEV
jgi:glutaredoxin|tara:strand:+ start:13551 stop:13970 length:420 start_codon:yes stop_codon:yes gene_type:complete